jgi:ribosomal protein S18 acetylase RimI-like enzyme
VAQQPGSGTRRGTGDERSGGASAARRAVRIERLLQPADEHVAALGRLLPQLSSVAPPDLPTLARICADRRVVLLLARLEGEIVGSLTVVLFETLTGVRAWIEDVVVDETRRGAGIGTALLEEALRIARNAGARSVDLTSRPSRQAANRLYERTGFERRDTNVWRHRIPT